MPTKDGLGRPFFVHRLHQVVLLACCGAWGLNGGAQEVIYRCGQEYTNAPSDVAKCERLAVQAVTVIPGVRPQPVPALATPAAPAAKGPDEVRSPEGATPAPTPAPTPAATRQAERDAQARTILAQELERVQKQHQAWVQAYKQGAPAQPGREQADPLQDPERVAALKAAIDRAARDIDSLQRELAARAVAQKAPKP